MFDLLNEKLITTQHEGLPLQMTLPEALSALSHGQELRFPRVQAHQKHAWFAFLVQSATLALHGDEETALKPTSSATWAELLLGLSEGNAAAWHLIIDNPGLPAFMQPPTRLFKEYKTRFETPLGIDLPVVAKAHDVKPDRHAYATAEDWLYALITMQTMQGYSGRGNYGVVRMNGGLGSRPYVALVPALGWAARFRRDVDLLLKRREKEGWGDEDQPRLLWLAPWEGTPAETLSLAQIDPDALEICRRFRLMRDADGRLYGLQAPSLKAKLDGGADYKGVSGDPWTPITKDAEPKALTVPAQGFDYKRIAQLLTEDGFKATLAQSPKGLDPHADAYLYLETLTRGQGKTEGFHQRVLAVSPKARRVFEDASERERLTAQTREWIEDAKIARLNILRPALLRLFQTNKGDDKRPDTWTARLDTRVDAHFFPMLFQSLELSDPRPLWRSTLRDLVQEVFNEAVAEAPSAGARRWRAIAEAEAVLDGTLRKRFSALYSQTDEVQAL
ncbi:hypothetical protein KKB55_21800 [Myxococcota bacterium]|nr:hypothetical protein [Myxococcota bacterium]MBU1900386.1 hypothetical protein [Myxococcota bacterium]